MLNHFSYLEVQRGAKYFFGDKLKGIYIINKLRILMKINIFKWLDLSSHGLASYYSNFKVESREERAEVKNQKMSTRDKFETAAT